MKNKLTEGELVEKIMHWYSECNSQKIRANIVYEVLKEKQAYNQLVEIVKEHFKRKEFTKGYEIIQIQQKPTVTREDIYNFRMNLFTISMEYGDELKEVEEEELEKRELNCIQKWLESRGLEVLKNERLDTRSKLWYTEE